MPCPGLLPWGLAFLRTTRGVSAGVPGSGAAGRKSLRARRPAFPANPTGDGLHPLQWPSGLRSCVTVPPVTHEDCHWEVKGPASVSSNMAEPGLGLDGRAQCLRPFLRPSRLRPTRPLLGPHGHPSSPGLLVFPLTGTPSPATSLVLVELPRKLSLRQGSRANGLFGRCNVRVIRGKKRGGASGKDGSSARQGPPC